MQNFPIAWRSLRPVGTAWQFRACNRWVSDGVDAPFLSWRLRHRQHGTSRCRREGRPLHPLHRWCSFGHRMMPSSSQRRFRVLARRRRLGSAVCPPLPPAEQTSAIAGRATNLIVPFPEMSPSPAKPAHYGQQADFQPPLSHGGRTDAPTKLQLQKDELAFQGDDADSKDQGSPIEAVGLFTGTFCGTLHDSLHPGICTFF